MLSGLALALFIIVIGNEFSLPVPSLSSVWPAGIFNTAQVLSVIVVSPDSGGGGTGGGGTGGSGGGGGGGGGAGGGAGVGAALPTQGKPPALPTDSSCSTKADINHDGKVNIVDFSILAYWYKRPLTADALKQCIDQNSDGKVTLADFSILAYYWTK